MSGAIKSLTPELVLEFVTTVVGSCWEGEREWDKVDIDVHSFKYEDINLSDEPVEFDCRIYSREKFSWLYGLSIRDICDAIDRHLEKSFNGRNFRCEAVRYEMKKIFGVYDFAIEFEIKIVDSENYTGMLKW